MLLFRRGSSQERISNKGNVISFRARPRADEIVNVKLGQKAEQHYCC